MNLEQQKQIIALYKQYNQVNKDIIKTNLKNYIDDSDHKLQDVASCTGIALQTIYSLRKHTSNYKPDFITALILCDFLKISITATIQPLPGLSITPEPQTINTKWTITAKQNFCSDYNSLDITALCKKYNITPRTAQEYNKNFIRDFEW